jgi:hypothetical protein
MPMMGLVSFYPRVASRKVESGLRYPKKETCEMKKLAALAVGIGLILGTVSFAQDTTDTTKKTEKKTKKKKKGGDDTTTPDDKK